MKCLKKGQTNKFGDKKEHNCIDYASTEHCTEYNPKATIPENWCKNCQSWWRNYVKEGVNYEEYFPTPS